MSQPASAPAGRRPEPGGPQDPYGAMLRGGAVPALAVSAVALVAFAVLDGRLGALGSALATAVVAATFASSSLLLQRTAALDPRVVFMIAMVSYTTKVGLLGLFLLLFRDATWFSTLAFAITAIAASLAWTIGEVVAFARVRTLVYDASRGGPPGGGPTG